VTNGKGEAKPGTGEIGGRSAAIFGRITEGGAGRLLGRDLERSTQILLGLTTISLCVNLIKITKFEWLGIYAAFPDRNRLLLSIFLGALTALAALYHREAADRAQLAREWRLAGLEEASRGDRVVLKRASAAVPTETAATEATRDAEASARRESKAAKAALQALRAAREEAERQDRTMRRFPPVVIIGSFLFQAAGVVLGSF
jgi:hypothetical protein